MIEQVSGDTIINAIVEHPNGLDHRNAYTTGQSVDAEHCRLRNKLVASSVYSPTRGFSVACMDIHGIAALLRQKGSPRTPSLVWHKNAMDLRILRNLLESLGYNDILFNDENCISSIPLFRENMFKGVPQDQQFHLTFEVVFPTMFPRRNLVGLNHMVLVDCQQTRLIFNGAI